MAPWACARKVYELWVNLYSSIINPVMDRHTYKHKLRLSLTLRHSAINGEVFLAMKWLGWLHIRIKPLIALFKSAWWHHFYSTIKSCHHAFLYYWYPQDEYLGGVVYTCTMLLGLHVILDHTNQFHVLQISQVRNIWPSRHSTMNIQLLTNRAFHMSHHLQDYEGKQKTAAMLKYKKIGAPMMILTKWVLHL